MSSGKHASHQKSLERVSEKIVMCEIMVKHELDETKGMMAISWFQDKHWFDFCLLVFPVVSRFISMCADSQEIALFNVFHVLSGVNIKVGYSFQPILSSVRCCLKPMDDFGHMDSAYCYKFYDFCNIKLVASIFSVDTDLSKLATGFSYDSSTSLGFNCRLSQLTIEPSSIQENAVSNKSGENINLEEEIAGSVKVQAKSLLTSTFEDSLCNTDVLSSEKESNSKQFHSHVQLIEDQNRISGDCEDLASFTSGDLQEATKQCTIVCDKIPDTCANPISSEHSSANVCFQSLDDIGDYQSTSLLCSAAKPELVSSPEGKKTLPTNMNETLEQISVMDPKKLPSPIMEEEENSELVSIREYIKLSSITSMDACASTSDNDAFSKFVASSSPTKNEISEDSSESDCLNIVGKPTRRKVCRKGAERGACQKPIDDGAVKLELAAIRECIKLSTKVREKNDAASAIGGKTDGELNCFMPSRIGGKTLKGKLTNKKGRRNVTDKKDTDKTVDHSDSKFVSIDNHQKHSLQINEAENIAKYCRHPTSSQSEDVKSPVTKSVVSDYFPVVSLHTLSPEEVENLRCPANVSEQDGKCGGIRSQVSVCSPLPTADNNDKRTADMCETKFPKEDSVEINYKCITSNLSEKMSSPRPILPTIISVDKNLPVCSKPKHKKRHVIGDSVWVNANSELDEFQSSKRIKTIKLKRQPADVLSSPTKSVKTAKKQRIKKKSTVHKSSVHSSPVSGVEDACKSLTRSVTSRSNFFERLKERKGTKPSEQFNEGYSSDDSLPESGIFGAKARKETTSEGELLMPSVLTGGDKLKKVSGCKKYSSESNDENTSWQLNEEIKNIRDIQQLNDSHIRYLLKLNEEYIKDIFRGKQFCRRHEDFKKGGKTKRKLNYEVNVTLFSDDQLDLILNYLNGVFCKRDKGYADYILAVLFPETLIKIVMDVRSTTHEEAEELMAKEVYGRH